MNDDTIRPATSQTEWLRGELLPIEVVFFSSAQLKLINQPKNTIRGEIVCLLDLKSYMPDIPGVSSTILIIRGSNAVMTLHQIWDIC